jgi:hypothetical protein
MTMKPLTIATLSACVLATAGLAGAAQADTGKTVQQAQADLAQALRDGTVVTGYQGMAPRQVRPDLYPATTAVPHESSAQVQAALDASLSAGTVVTDFQGMSPRQLHPELYPPSPVATAKSRAQVEDELASAMRAGNVAVDFQGMTPRQIAHGAYVTPGNPAQASAGPARANGS